MPTGTRVAQGARPADALAPMPICRRVVAALMSNSERTTRGLNDGLKGDGFSSVPDGTAAVGVTSSNG
jgi:hypothetical protein